MEVIHIVVELIESVQQSVPFVSGDMDGDFGNHIPVPYVCCSGIADAGRCERYYSFRFWFLLRFFSALDLVVRHDDHVGSDESVTAGQ